MTNVNSKIMTKKTLSFKKTLEKVDYFYNVISDTIIWIEKYKTYDIINSSDLNVSILNLENIYKELNLINDTLIQTTESSDQIVSKLQKINDEISMIFKSFGTKNIEYILNICYGNNYLKNIINDDNFSKFELILKYAHPISYKVMQWKNNPTKVKNNEKIMKNKIIEDFTIIETGQNLDCYDLCRTTNNFYTKVFGVKIVFQNPEKKNTIIIYAIIDEILSELGEFDRKETSRDIDEIITKSASDAPNPTKKMSKSEIQDAIDSALDSGDFSKVGEFSRMMDELYPQK